MLLSSHGLTYKTMYTRSLEMDTHFLALEMHVGCLHAYIYDVYVFFHIHLQGFGGICMANSLDIIISTFKHVPVI